MRRASARWERSTLTVLRRAAERGGHRERAGVGEQVEHAFPRRGAGHASAILSLIGEEPRREACPELHAHIHVVVADGRRALPARAFPRSARAATARAGPFGAGRLCGRLLQIDARESDIDERRGDGRRRVGRRVVVPARGENRESSVRVDDEARQTVGGVVDEAIGVRGSGDDLSATARRLEQRTKLRRRRDSNPWLPSTGHRVPPNWVSFVRRDRIAPF